MSYAAESSALAAVTVRATDPGGLEAMQQVQVTVEASRSERERALKLALTAFGRSLGAETVDAIGGRLGVESSSALRRSHVRLGARSVGCGAFGGGGEQGKGGFGGGSTYQGQQESAAEVRPGGLKFDPLSRRNLLSQSSFQLSFGGGAASFGSDADSLDASPPQAAASRAGWTLWG